MNHKRYTKENITMSIVVPADLREAVLEMAQDLDCSSSKIAKRALIDHVDAYITFKDQRTKATAKPKKE